MPENVDMSIENEQQSDINQKESHWYDNLPNEYKANNTVKNSKSIEDYVKWGVNAEKLIGSKVSIPKEGDDKAWNEFYTKLGRPQKPEDYKIDRPNEEKLREVGLPYDIEAEKEFLSIAHKNGVNEKTVNELIKWNLAREEAKYKQMQEQNNKQIQEQKDDALKALQKEWGKEYDARKAQLDRFVQSTMDNELAAAVDESGFGNDPRFIKWVYEKMAKHYVDNSIPKGGSVVGDTAETLDKQISELRNNQEFNKRYYSTSSKVREEANRELSDLYRKKSELMGANK